MQKLRFAALSDIHGNVWALDAVLADLRKRNLSSVVNLGDHVYGPLKPLDTAERLMSLGWTCLRGNCDRLLLEGGPASATAVHNRNDLKGVHRSWLSAMPQIVTWNGIFLCHGTPAFDDVCLLEDIAETAVYIRSSEDILATLKGVSRDGAGMAAVEQQIEYKRELRAGDLITIRSRVLEIKEKSIRFAHDMTNDEDGELAARTVVVGVYFDTTLRKARSLPSDVSQRAQVMIVKT